MKTLLSVIFSLMIGIYTSQVGTFPHFTNFASGFGDWSQSTTDDFDWTQKTSGTNSSGTGPQSSPYGANGTTGYVYTETSSPIGNNETARIYCTYDLSSATTASVTFYYHIYAASGYGPGTLRLKVYKGNSSSGGSLHYPWTVTTSYNGWQQATINLNDYVGFSYVQLAFESTTAASGTVWQCDNAIDEVVVSTTGNSGGGGGGTTVETGDPNSTLQNGRVPAYGYYDYSWSSAIYTSLELGGTPETIEKISWNVTNSNSMTLNDQEIWIAHTPEEEFPDGTMPDVGNGPWTGFVKVYNGSINFIPGWNEIVLTTPFSFNGVENLLVKVVNNHGAYALSYPEFQYTSKTNSVVYNYNDGSFPSTAGYRNAYRPNTRFAMSGGDALPIDLISFNGDVLDDVEPVVLLEWTVANQVNNEYYKIERSRNLNVWSVVDSIPGSGTTNMELKYSLIDDNPFGGVSYYRLSQTDRDGNTEIFKPIAITISNKEKVIDKIINLNGQEVSNNYRGIIIEIYTDGTYLKKYKEQ